MFYFIKIFFKVCCRKKFLWDINVGDFFFYKKVGSDIKICLLLELVLDKKIMGYLIDSMEEFKLLVSIYFKLF